LLWLNLVTNGIQDVALAFEPGEGDALNHRPRSPREPVFNRLMVERTLMGAAVMGLAGFGTYTWLLQSGISVFSARNILLLLMVLFEMVHIGNCRSEYKSAFQLSPLHSPIVVMGAVIAFLVHLLMMYLPIGRTLLSIEPVDAQAWVLLTALSLSVLVPIEIDKIFKAKALRNRQGTSSR
ncbi:MAG: cation transporting ATPase C-terminal domain-containing protein, partial [Cyanobacteria bacterium J06555_13]